ncbi:hypothetical protein CPB85DRAFT_1344185 [Mucidula mucida]|nr:hypothetical protein CPB85DRAFT_1344185 [Mucidula mucida]
MVIRWCPLFYLPLQKYILYYGAYRPTTYQQRNTHQTYLPPSLTSSILREFDVLRYVAWCTVPYIFSNDCMLLVTNTFQGLHSIAILLGADRLPFMASFKTMKQFERERRLRVLSVQETQWVCVELWGMIEGWKKQCPEGFPGSLVCRYPVPIPSLPVYVQPPREEGYGVKSEVDWDSLFESWVTVPEEDSGKEDSGEDLEAFARFLVEYFKTKPDQGFLTSRREGYGNRALRVSDADIARAGIDWYRYSQYR